jgi:superfamily II DNA or RNA helicase
MCSVEITEPTKVRVKGVVTSDQRNWLAAQLTYEDKTVTWELNKHKKSHWYAEKYGQEAWQDRLKELQAQQKKCLLFEDTEGLWTYSGLAEKVGRILGCQIVNHVEYPEPGILGWHNKPKLTPYQYQSDSKDLLFAARHAAVEVGTGLGKSFTIELLVKELGLRTLIMAPSKDIAKRLYEDCVSSFGEKKVGFFGDGKKKTGKLITVGISASLTRIEPGSKEWNDLAKTQVFIADESHQCPASTLAKVCFGLMANAPYRFFFSATQERNDGLDMLLDGITGPIVYRKTVREGIDEGYLAALNFVMVQSASDSDWYSSDPNEMTREHLYYNKRVLRQAADLANKFVSVYKQQVLILVEELEQFAQLLPFLQHPVKFAHGGVNKDNAAKLPKPFHDSDPSKFVKEFNAGEFPILVGTSCITTGTDIKANEATIYLQGGRSRIQVMQGPCGRSTRLFTFPDGRKKTLCTVIDFDVQNIETTHRHALDRKAIYDQTYGPTKEIAYGNPN